MINNRQNGRRRGRGGQQARNGQPGGQDRGNRIDNRARGNAAQLLEKYKSLARDAQTQGDRVNTEYYLQFADHYFRVLSESRSRFDEQRPTPARRDDFGHDMDEEQEGQSGFEQRGEGENGWDGEEERPRHQEERPRQQEARQRDDRPRQDDRSRQQDDRPRQQDPRQQEGRQQDDRPRQQPRRYERTEQQLAERTEFEADGAQPRSDDQLRENAPRENAPRDGQPRERRPRRERSGGNAYAARTEGEPEVSERIEIDRLPQGFATTPAAPAAPVAAEAETAEAEAPRVRRPRAPRKPKGEAVTVDA